MIVFYTDQDKKELKRIDTEYAHKLKEVEALIEELRPGDTGPEGPEGALAGSPEADEMDRNYEAWLAAGSPEWRAARKKRLKLIDEQTEAFWAFNRTIEQREFSKIAGDRDKIIKSAEEQINLVIDNRYNGYKKMITTGKDVDGEDISGFSSYDLRIDGKRIYLDTETIIAACKSVLRLHLNDRAQDPEALQEINDLIFSIVSDSPKTSSDKGELGATFTIRKRKPRTLQKAPFFSNNETFSMFSTTQLKDTIYTILSYDADIEKAARSINKTSKKAEVGAYISPDKRRRAIQVKTDNSHTIVELLGNVLDNVKSQPTKKILHFIESEIYKSIYYKGHLNDNVVTFSLRNMVDKKLYANEPNARRAFREASEILTSLRVNASLKTGKDKMTATTSDGITAVFFPTMMVNNGLCYVRLNQDINWTPYLKDFFLMPDSWYALPDNAADLEYKIFRTIRQKKNKIDENGKLVVNIKLSTVAEWLDLPLDTKNPKRNVKDRIELAIKQIQNSLDRKSFSIELATDLGAPLEEYLSGHLQVTASGIYTENLINLVGKQQARIQKAIARKEAIINEASIRKLTETMKEEAASAKAEA